MVKVSDYKLPVKQPSRNYPPAKSSPVMVKDTDKDNK